MECESLVFGTTWGWVINARMFIFGWIPFRHVYSSLIKYIFFMLLLLTEHWHPLVDCKSPCESKPCSPVELLIISVYCVTDINCNSPKPWMFYNPALPCLHIQPWKNKTAFLYDTILHLLQRAVPTETTVECIHKCAVH